MRTTLAVLQFEKEHLVQALADVAARHSRTTPSAGAPISPRRERDLRSAEHRQVGTIRTEPARSRRQSPADSRPLPNDPAGIARRSAVRLNAGTGWFRSGRNEPCIAGVAPAGAR